MIMLLQVAVVIALVAGFVFWATQWILARRELRQLVTRIDHEYAEMLRKNGWPHHEP